jgi:NADPH:quinone reductase and related Zn-dependent oxidoreductases
MVKAAPIYPWDVKIRKNQYARPVEKLPAILGQEVSGSDIILGVKRWVSPMTQYEISLTGEFLMIQKSVFKYPKRRSF